MRTMLRGKVTLLFMTLGLLLAFPAVALAVDTINADLIDFNSQNADYTAGDTNGVNTAYWIQPDSVCDAADGGAVKFKLNVTRQSDNLDVTSSSFKARLSTAAAGTEQALNNFELTFDKCSTTPQNQTPTNTQTVVFTSAANLAPGKYKVEVNTSTITDSNDAASAYSASNQNSFLINVSAPAVTDADGDGVADGSDNCPSVANPNQADADGDGQGDACDATPNGPDTDSDGVPDSTDNCDNVANPAQTDTDGDGTGDACDTQDNGDTDSDGVQNYQDNCPATANPEQTDTDGDGLGDACDADDDNDQVNDDADNCPVTANANQADADGDGQGDACDSTPRGHDNDNDGLPALDDNCPDVSNANQADLDGDGAGDACDEPDAPTLSLTTDTGSSSSDKVTNDDTPTFGGTAQAGHTVKIYDGSGTSAVLLGTVTAHATTGAWSFTVGDPATSAPGVTDLSDGTHTITATASNSVLTSDPATSLSNVVIDTVDPAVNCDPSADPTVWQPDNVDFVCTFSDNAGGSGLAPNQGLDADDSFTLSTSVDPGDETATASTGSKQVFDLAGNDVTAGPFTDIMVDRKAPSTTADAGTSYTFGDWTNQNVTVTLDAIDGGSGVKTTQYSLNGGAYQAYPSGGILVDTEGDHTVSFKSTDNVDNAETAQSVSVKIDKTAPTITNLGPTPASPNGANNWYTTNVSNSFKASDTLSGLNNACVTAFPAQGTDNVQSKTTSGEGSVKVTSDSCTDVAGNTADGIDSANFQVDLVKPTVNITNAPAEGTTFNICSGPLPSPSFTASDTPAGSGVDTSSGSFTTQPLQPPDGTGAGNYTYKAQATDFAGWTNSATRSYSVLYSGAFGGIQQPINADGTSRFKVGSTVPVKFTLTCNGTPITNASAKLAINQSDSKPDAGFDEAISTSAATTGNLFRLSDASTGQYIFNLSTKNGYTNPTPPNVGSFSQGTWTIWILLDDGTSRSVKIQLVR